MIRRAMRSHTKLRFCTLIILACAFLIILPISPATSTTRSAAQGQTNERPNPVRRFFSWVAKAVRRPFRKRVPPISDPPIVFITSSTSLINFCPPWLESIDNCAPSSEVELSATAGGPEVDAKLLFAWTVSAGRIRGEGQKVR